MVKNLFDEVKKDNFSDNLIEMEEFIRIALKLLNEQKSKYNSDLNNKQTQNKQLQVFKNYIEKLHPEDKYLSNSSLH